MTSQTDDGEFDINADIDKDEGEYSKSEGVTITVTLDGTKDIPEDYKESIDNFVDSTNYYDKYELKYE